ncbi:MAG: dTDP-glucose 4,6-dehydratase [bacterium]|nr:dTDP-glucose 4,6-dehydratase [bacterium]
MKRILVTGGCGFIGSNFIRYILGKYSYEMVNLDALTYAGNPNNLKDLTSNNRYHFIHGRIEDVDTVKQAMKGVDAVVHFAAESHVDRSILNAQPFIITNVLGTQTLLDVARESKIERFIHISTDEVYGQLGVDGKFKEDTPLRPNSPYSASKASTDLLVMAYYHTYGMPVIIARPSNNYGPYQYPEKFIPLMITNLFEDRPIPVYGRGKNIRDWLYVEDCCQAINLILHKGRIGEIYNIGGQSEYRNIDIAKKLINVLNKDETYIKFVSDRPGHDFRYALDISKIKEELKWQPSLSFEDGLRETITWFKENRWWWEPLKRKLEKESKGFWS